LYGESSITMAAEKIISTCIRASRRFNAMSEVAAVRERRGLTHMFKARMRVHCEQQGSEELAAGSGRAKGAEK